MKENSVPKILRMNPKIFLIWIFMISISMIFVSLISAYIVKKGEPGGFNVDLPSMFYYSTIVVILSSIFKQLSYFSTKKDDFKTQKIISIRKLCYWSVISSISVLWLGSVSWRWGIFCWTSRWFLHIYFKWSACVSPYLWSYFHIIYIQLSNKVKCTLQKLTEHWDVNNLLAFSCRNVGLFIYYFVFL